MRLFITSLGTSEANILPENGVRVFIMTGQSNSRGRGLNDDATPEELAINPRVQIWNTTANEFQSLEIGVNNMAPNTYSHGAELGLSSRLDDYFPDETVYLIKYGQGSTCIVEHLPGGSVYPVLWSDYVIEGINDLISQGKIPYVYMLWSQGECDVNIDNTGYGVQFNEWVDLWQGNFSNKLPFATYEVSDYSWASNPIGLVNDVFHEKALTEPLLYAMDTKDMGVNPGDDIHYSYQGQKDISNLAFSYFKTLLGYKQDVPL